MNATEVVGGSSQWETTPLLISFDPMAAYPELPYHRAETTKEEKQSQGCEEHAEDENQI